MTNEVILIENDSILRNINKHRIRSLDRVISNSFSRVRHVEHLSSCIDYTRLGGKKSESRGYDYFVGSKEVGFLAVRDVGFEEGLLHLSLPSEAMQQVLNYLKENDRVLYEVLSKGYSRREAA